MSLLWKNIISLAPLFFPNVRFEVGNGKSVKFWTDLWWGDMCLSSTFPRPFRFVVHKDALVSDVLSSSSSGLS